MSRLPRGCSLSASSTRAGTAATDAVDAILSGYPGLQAAQEALYKDLHAHPELSHHERRTARSVAGELATYGAAVQTGIGGTGVVGLLANGDGPTVRLRAELDALPIAEDTGVDYASTVTTTGADGQQVPVAHACGHDLHMACLLAAVRLMADRRDRWKGTLLALFQPAEETGDGAQGMIADRLQTVVSREVTPGDTAIVTVGAVQAGARGNVIPDHAVLQLNMRSYSEPTRQRMLDAIKRIVRGECQASGSPREPEFETVASFPLLANDTAVADQVAAAFTAHFGKNALDIPKQTVSEDFGVIPASVGAPYTYWGIGRTERQAYLAAEKAGRLQDLPSNHSPKFLPPLQPTLRTGTEAMVVGAMAWLGPH